MAPNSLSPAFIRIAVNTAYALHLNTFPTRAWLPTSITGTMGSYLGWNGTPVDGEEMIDELVAALKAFYLATTHIVSATIFTQALPKGEAIQRANKNMSVAGTSTATGQAKAVQTTFNGKTVDNGHFKVCLLDAPCGSGTFDKILPDGFTSEVTDLNDILRADGRAWSGRDDAQPSDFISITFDLNDKLRREYRMV